MSNRIDIREFSSTDTDIKAQAIRTIREGLSAFNVSSYPDATHDLLHLGLFQGDQVVGGLIGRMAWGWLRLDFFWIADAFRGQGYGTQLLNQAEAIARSKGCHAAHTDTFSFQALDFYLAAGYEVFGQLNDYPPGETHYFLQKSL
jgi:GNAT superfamily N-acetyltransferase